MKRLLFLGALAAAGAAHADPAPVAKVGDRMVFRDLGLSAPAKLAGCEDAVIVPSDELVEGVVQYACAHGVTLSIWTRRAGWRDAAEALETGRQMLPEDGDGWLANEEPDRAGFKVGVAFDPLSARRWLAPAKAPKVMIELAWPMTEPGADEEAERALAALLEQADLAAGD